MKSTAFKSGSDLLDFLDEYASERKGDLDRRWLEGDTGLIKSYMLETMRSNRSDGYDVYSMLSNGGYIESEIGEGDVVTLNIDGMRKWYLEVVTSRHFLLHTFEEASKADGAIRRFVNDSSLFDFVWLSGQTFHTLWKKLIHPTMPTRYITMKFEYLSRFEDEDDQMRDEMGDEYISIDAEYSIERRASNSTMTEPSNSFSQFLPALQDSHPPFKSIKMLRFPARIERGGYDVWDWGKITHRSPTFRDGRDQAIDLLKIYETTTKMIEDIAWMQISTTEFSEGRGTYIDGSPITIQFPSPLNPATFKNLVETTFNKGYGPLKIIGNPIWLSEKRVHIYGVDMHLWHQIYLDFSPERIVIILPEGTCGNSVHRLFSVIQKFLDPSAEMFIGKEKYQDIFLLSINNLGDE